MTVELLTLEEAAEASGRSVSWVRSHRRFGPLIPGMKDGKQAVTADSLWRLVLKPKEKHSVTAQATEVILPAALTVKEAARYLSISVTSIYRIIGAGDLATIKLGGRTLLRRSDLDALLHHGTPNRASMMAISSLAKNLHG